MKGIVLAGGAGTRLYPLTLSISKQLIPVYDKPMIYYPISTLISMGIKEILIISTERDIHLFRNLLKDGSDYGCKFSYLTQTHPNGIAEAFLIGRDFINNSNVTLILGDNIFYSPSTLFNFNKDISGAHIFAYHVSNPQRYGVVEFNKENEVISIEEKPKYPKSNFAIPGLYVFDSSVVSNVENLAPSSRGELEITDLLDKYLKSNTLKVTKMDKGTAWLDTGTFSSLMQASQFVQVLEKRQGFKVGCIEEVAYKMGYINSKQLEMLANRSLSSGYGKYLISLVNENK
jgi:glucose-1-phosphate thymidylyltransferase